MGFLHGRWGRPKQAEVERPPWANRAQRPADVKPPRQRLFETAVRTS